MLCPGSGEVLDCIDSLSLHSRLLSYIMGVCVRTFLIVGSLARVHTYAQANAKESCNIHEKGVYRPIPGHPLN